MLRLRKTFYGIMLFLLNISPVLAQSGFGGVANNLMDPVSLFYQFIKSACLLMGGGFVFASLVKYFEHRRSPLMVPMSTVVFLFIAGIILIALPLIAYVSQSGGVQYKFT
jgi:hypothetical protein